MTILPVEEVEKDQLIEEADAEQVEPVAQYFIEIDEVTSSKPVDEKTSESSYRSFISMLGLKTQSPPKPKKKSSLPNGETTIYFNNPIRFPDDFDKLVH